MAQYTYELQLDTRRFMLAPLSICARPLTSSTEYPDERTWCRDVQALKSFVWIEFVARACHPTIIVLAFSQPNANPFPVTVFFAASFTLRYAITEHRRGRKQIWNGPLSRYVPLDSTQRDQFSRQTVTDYFGARGTSAFEKF